MSEMQSPILITGAARSGTSLVAGAFNICGGFGGDMSGPNKNNEKGMFENSEIRNNIVKPYLKSIEVDKLGQYPLPDTESQLIPRDWQGRIENVMREQGYKRGVWFYKGAKLCLVWPVWHYAYPNAKWVVVRRKSADIANSCCKTGFMRAFSKDQTQRAVGVTNEFEGWLWWVRQHEERFREMIEAGLNCKVVWPERMVSGDYTQIKEAIEWAGLQWNSEVVNFIEPKLWKARQKQQQGD